MRIIGIGLCLVLAVIVQAETEQDKKARLDILGEPNWREMVDDFERQLHDAKTDEDHLKCRMEAYKYLDGNYTSMTQGWVAIRLYEFTCNLPAGNIRHKYIEIMSIFLNKKNGVKCSMLLDFNKEDFTDLSRTLVMGKVMPPHKRNDYLLAGIVDFDSIKDKLKPYRYGEWTKNELGYPSKIKYGMKWTALLVYARNGDKDACREIIDVIKTEKNEDLVLNCLMPDLYYVKQPEIVVFLGECLNNDAVGIPGADDYPPTYRYERAISNLQKMLIGFPVNPYNHYTKWGGTMLVTIPYLKECREWFAKQKEWHFK